MMTDSMKQQIIVSSDPLELHNRDVNFLSSIVTGDENKKTIYRVYMPSLTMTEAEMPRQVITLQILIWILSKVVYYG